MNLLVIILAASIAGVLIAIALPDVGVGRRSLLIVAVYLMAAATVWLLRP